MSNDSSLESYYQQIADEQRLLLNNIIHAPADDIREAAVTLALQYNDYEEWDLQLLADMTSADFLCVMSAMTDHMESSTGADLKTTYTTLADMTLKHVTGKEWTADSREALDRLAIVATDEIYNQERDWNDRKEMIKILYGQALSIKTPADRAFSMSLAKPMANCLSKESLQRSNGLESRTFMGRGLAKLLKDDFIAGHLYGCMEKLHPPLQIEITRRREDYLDRTAFGNLGFKYEDIHLTFQRDNTAMNPPPVYSEFHEGRMIFDRQPAKESNITRNCSALERKHRLN